MLAWLTQPQAAAALGVSERTLLRMWEKGSVERRNAPRPGRKPEPLYNPADIERLRAASKTLVVAPETTAVAPAVPPPPALEELAKLLAPPRPPRLWMTVEEAREYSGLSAALLRRLIKHGQVKAIRDGGWKISRFDLDNADSFPEKVSELSTAVRIVKMRG